MGPFERSNYRVVAAIAILAIGTIMGATPVVAAGGGVIVSFTANQGDAFPVAATRDLTTCRYPDIAALASRHGCESVRALWRGDRAGLKNVYLFEFPPGADQASLEAARDEFRSNNRVRIAEVDQEMMIISQPEVIVPNDYWYNHSYPWDDHLACFPDPTHHRQWYLTRSGYDRAWAISTGDAGQVIAIMDTGLDYLHPDFAERILWNDSERYGIPGVDDDQNGFIDDVCGWDFGDNDNDVLHDPPGTPGLGADRHGTAMTSVFGASTDNEPTGTEPRGIASEVWQTKVLPFKIFGRQVSYVSAAVSAYNYLLDYVVRHGVSVAAVNMSWIVPGSSSTLETLFVQANAAGIQPVGGAGNYDANYVYFPCSSEQVLCAACVDSSGVKLSGTDGSNYGTAVDICGFGSKVCDWNWCAPQPGKAPQLQCLGYEPADPYGWRFCGSVAPHIVGFTSMLTSGATAQASGLVGLVKSVHPDLSTAQVRAMIRRGAVNVDAQNPGQAGLLGAGYLHAYRTLTLWGTVARDTTLAGEVWMAGDVVVEPGVTLTLAAGTHILVAPDDISPSGLGRNDPARCELIIRGDVRVDGTGAEPVVFESWATEPEAGDWTGITALSGAGGVDATHLTLKHADTGLHVTGTACDVDHGTFESCITGAYVQNAACNFSATTASHGGTGFHFAAGTADCTITAGSQADQNTLDGILCNSAMTIGPDVSVADNGRHGINLDGAGVGGLVTHVSLTGQAAGYGIYCSNSSPQITYCYIAENLINVALRNGAKPILGNAATGVAGYNSILDPGQYHVGNFVRNFTLMAENCHWGDCGEGYLPELHIYGLVDLNPWFCSSPLSRSSADAPVVAESSWVAEAHPNPLNPSTRLEFYVPDDRAPVSVRIFDINGRLVATLIDGVVPGGRQAATWQGTDDSGQRVASGLYFARVQIGGETERTIKLSILR